MTSAEKIELAELLAYQSRSDFDIRKERMHGAEARLGWWRDGKFEPNGLAEIINAARLGKRSLSRDEFTAVNAGFSSLEELRSER